MNLKMTFAILMGLNLGVIFMNIPPVLDGLMILYGVSYTRISILLSALLWSHALMQVPAGMMTDHFGMRRVIIDEVQNDSGNHLSGKALFSFGTIRRFSIP